MQAITREALSQKFEIDPEFPVHLLFDSGLALLPLQDEPGWTASHWAVSISRAAAEVAIRAPSLLAQRAPADDTTLAHVVASTYVSLAREILWSWPEAACLTDANDLWVGELALAQWRSLSVLFLEHPPIAPYTTEQMERLCRYAEKRIDWHPAFDEI